MLQPLCVSSQHSKNSRQTTQWAGGSEGTACLGPVGTCQVYGHGLLKGLGHTVAFLRLVLAKALRTVYGGEEDADAGDHIQTTEVI